MVDLLCSSPSPLLSDLGFSPDPPPIRSTPTRRRLGFRLPSRSPPILPLLSTLHGCRLQHARRLQRNLRRESHLRPEDTSGSRIIPRSQLPSPCIPISSGFSSTGGFTFLMGILRLPVFSTALSGATIIFGCGRPSVSLATQLRHRGWFWRLRDERRRGGTVWMMMKSASRWEPWPLLCNPKNKQHLVKFFISTLLIIIAFLIFNDDDLLSSSDLKESHFGISFGISFVNSVTTHFIPHPPSHPIYPINNGHFLITRGDAGSLFSEMELSEINEVKRGANPIELEINCDCRPGC